jgi:hypothetical protein
MRSSQVVTPLQFSSFPLPVSRTSFLARADSAIVANKLTALAVGDSTLLAGAGLVRGVGWQCQRDGKGKDCE